MTLNQTYTLTQGLFGLGDDDAFELVLLLRLGAVESVSGRRLMPVGLLSADPRTRTRLEHLRQRGASPASGALQREHGVFAFTLLASGAAVPEGRPPPLRGRVRRRVQRDLVEVDGADGADVFPERRAGVPSVGQQPVGEHGAGGRRSQVSGLCVVSVHRHVQQRGEEPGGTGPLPGPPGPGHTELLQLVQ